MRNEYDFSQGKRGPVAPVQPGKVRITIRLDADILDWFRGKVNERGGGNYQTMMNDALRVLHPASRPDAGRDLAQGDPGRTAGPGLNVAGKPCSSLHPHAEEVVKYVMNSGIASIGLVLSRMR